MSGLSERLDCHRLSPRCVHSTNTHVPAPPWAAVAPVKIPFASCNKAADLLIDWFGPDDLKHVVGGERWWQIRGLDGIDSEWITESKYLNNDAVASHEKLSETEKYIARMEHLESVMASTRTLLSIRASHYQLWCSFMSTGVRSIYVFSQRIAHSLIFIGAYFWGSISRFPTGGILLFLH